jgi:hypothetical protein
MSKKTPLELALQRSQVALHEASLEVGRLRDLEDRVRRALTGWEDLSDDCVGHPAIAVKKSTDLWSILPPK